jgi:GxxExxY protein
MPITSAIPSRPISQEEFAELDYQVMRHAFDCHNQLGRLCDEVIYQNDLASRLEAAGLGRVQIEVPITVCHGDFAKGYSLDLVVADAAIYELKTALSFAPDHKAQLLNYLFLRGAQHGKLVNFRPTQVQTRFVNTTITPEQRHQFRLIADRWRDYTLPSTRLREHFVGLLQDWGAFLELPLYIEALIHFSGGEQQVLKMVPFKRDGKAIGNQRLHMVDPETAFRITSIADGTEHYEQHLRSLLNHSPLRTLQWINMSHHDIHLTTLIK